MGSVNHAKKEAAAAGKRGDARARARFLEDIKRSTKDLREIEEEQGLLRDALKQMAMSVAANAMAHEQRQAERRRARGVGKRERARGKFSARAAALLQEAARVVASVTERREEEQEQQQQQQQQHAAAGSSTSSPTRGGGAGPTQQEQQEQQEQQHCFRAGGRGGYCYAPDPWRFDPFLAPLPAAIPMPFAVAAASASSAVDPLLTAADEPTWDTGNSLSLPDEYLPGPPPPPAMLPQRGDAIRGVALDVPNPFDAASRAVQSAVAEAEAGADGGMGWLPRQESQMKDAVLPPGLLADAALASEAAAAGNGEEATVLERLQGLLALGPQLVQNPGLLAEARVRGLACACAFVVEYMHPHSPFPQPPPPLQIKSNAGAGRPTGRRGLVVPAPPALGPGGPAAGGGEGRRQAGRGGAAVGPAGGRHGGGGGPPDAGM